MRLGAVAMTRVTGALCLLVGSGGVVAASADDRGPHHDVVVDGGIPIHLRLAHVHAR